MRLDFVVGPIFSGWSFRTFAKKENVELQLNLELRANNNGARYKLPPAVVVHQQSDS